MAGSIQFKGIEQVIQAFQYRDVDAWSVWQHKQFMFKGFGDAALMTLLQNLSQSATNAIYTIKVYEDIEKEDDISQVKEKTPCDGSFNFRLNSDNQEITGSQYSSLNRYSSQQKEIDELKLLLAERDKDEDDEPEEETLEGKIGNAVVGIIEDPNKLKQWIEVLQGIGILPTKQGAAQPTIIRQLDPPAALGKVGNTDTAAPVIDDEKVNRIYMAVENLSKADPKLMEHLETLAIMAQDKPVKFKSLLLMLENF